MHTTKQLTIVFKSKRFDENNNHYGDKVHCDGCNMIDVRRGSGTNCLECLELVRFTDYERAKGLRC